MTLTEEQCAVMRKTLEHVIAHPEEWRQQDWGTRATGSEASACRTAFCFAGHAAVTVGGATPVWDQNDAYLTFDARDANGPVRLLALVRDARDVEWSVARYADHVLGLAPGRGATLFRGDNSLRRLAELCYLYTDGRVDLVDVAAAAPHQNYDGERACAEVDESYAHDENVRFERSQARLSW